MPKTSYHQFPKWLLNNPYFIYLFYWWNDLVFQRNWILWPKLHKALRCLPSGATICDAGAGEGHHLIRLAKKYPNLHFIGIDLLPSNIEMLEALKKHYKIRNLKLVEGNLEMRLPFKANFIYCIGVLQYIHNDQNALNHLADNLQNKGCIFVYSPVNDIIKWGFYKRARENWPHYELSQNRQRVYNSDLLNRLFKESKLKVLTEEKHIGYFGIWAHEFYSTLFLNLQFGHVLLKPFWGIGIIILLPIISLLKLIDMNSKKEPCNAIFFELIKE